MSETRAYRNVFSIEVLSSEQLPEGLDLETVAYEITDGGCSGWVTHSTVNEPLDAQRTAALLTAQGSDPEFLLGDEPED